MQSLCILDYRSNVYSVRRQYHGLRLDYVCSCLTVPSFRIHDSRNDEQYKTEGSD